jgi:hypothetical protein
MDGRGTEGPEAWRRAEVEGTWERAERAELQPTKFGVEKKLIQICEF